MANRLPLRHLLVALTLSILLPPISPFNSSPHPSPPPTAAAAAAATPTPTVQPPQQPKPMSPPQDQLRSNIVSALLAAGEFRRFATLLSAAAAVPFPLYTATLFVPSDQALSHFPTPTPLTPSFDPFLVPYHILPHRLPFSSLLLLKPPTRLPTLLPSNSILVTRNSGPSNFSLDGSAVTHPDLYASSAVVVHGVSNVLDYSVYGVGEKPSVAPPLTTGGPENDTAAPPLRGPCRGRKSGASGLGGSDGIALVFVVVGAAFAFKI